MYNCRLLYRLGFILVSFAGLRERGTSALCIIHCTSRSLRTLMMRQLLQRESNHFAHPLLVSRCLVLLHFAALRGTRRIFMTRRRGWNWRWRIRRSCWSGLQTTSSGSGRSSSLSQTAPRRVRSRPALVHSLFEPLHLHVPVATVSMSLVSVPVPVSVIYWRGLNGSGGRMRMSLIPIGMRECRVQYSRSFRSFR